MTHRDAWLRLWDWAENRAHGELWGFPDLDGVPEPAARVLRAVREAVARANTKGQATFVERQEAQEFMADRLLAWMAKAPEMQCEGVRKPAWTAFTEGPMRRLATAFEPLLTLYEDQYRDFEATLARLRAQTEEDLARFAELRERGEKGPP